MAERNMSKPRAPRGATQPRTPIAAPAKAARRDTPKVLESAIERLETSVRDLKRERDSLTTELAAAKAEIATLDAARRAAIDRIDWVIDSLQAVLQDKS